MNDLEEIVYKHALLNAAKHKGSANPGAVIGSIMSQEPDLRSRAKEIGPIAGKIVAQVNKLSEDEQSAQMAKYHVEVKENKQKKEEGLQELPGSHDNVVMRFAPNPSGPLHIGHARAAVPNAEYVKRYGGKLILRIEDTDPKRVFEPAYDLIPQDLKWLGIKADEVYYQSDRFEIYYDYARQLIEKELLTCVPVTELPLRSLRITVNLAHVEIIVLRKILNCGINLIRCMQEKLF